MTDVHAVLGVPRGVNMGMAVAELGLVSVARAAGVSVVPRVHPALLRARLAEVDYAETLRRCDVGLGPAVPMYELPTADEGRVLYWGGAHHMREYVDAVARFDYGDVDRAAALLLARGRSAADMRTVQSFGSAMRDDPDGDFAPGWFREALDLLLQGCGGAWFRDPVSLSVARRVGETDTVRAGVDPALLADRPSADGDGHVATFLGRATVARDALEYIASWFSADLQVPARGLDWGGSDAFPFPPEPSRRQLAEGADSAPDVREVLGQLSGARAVVTDSQQLALIAWGWGIPAVTLIASRAVADHGVDGASRDPGRDTGDVIASRYRARDLLLSPYDWSEPATLHACLERLRERLADDLMSTVTAAVSREVSRARYELLASWREPSPTPTQRLDLSRQSRTPAVTAAAVVSIRDETEHVDGVIGSLVLGGLDVVVLANDLDAETQAKVTAWTDRGVIGVHTWPLAKSVSITEVLRRKQEIIATLDHDWVLNVDADEWLHSPRPNDRLIDLMGRAQLAGDTVVNFEEFVFVPDVMLRPGEDPRERFLTYYFFRPADFRLMRAWRRDAGLSNVEGAGHELSGAAVRVHPEQGVLRHYPVLSPQHGVRKYVGRIYASDELERGWHANRINLDPANFTLRPAHFLRRLDRWDATSFDRSVSTRWHFWEPQWPGA